MEKSHFLFILIIITAYHILAAELKSGQIIIPDDYSTIQEGIDASESGDTVLVKPGVYHEFLVMKDFVHVIAEGEDDGNWNRAKRTKIYSTGLRDSLGNITPVVNCADGAILDGFEITGMDTVNHHLPGHSHAVQNRGESGIILNCIVHHNGSTGIGSHMKDGREANPTIINNIVHDNFGIGIGFNHSSKGTAKNNIVYNNRETGIGIQNGAAPVIEENKVYSNGWSGIAVRKGGNPDIRFNEVFANGVDPTGDGVPEGAGTGIGADSSGGYISGLDSEPVFIFGNKVYDNTNGGIMIRNNSYVLVKGNNSYNNASMQIACSDSSKVEIDSNSVDISNESQFEASCIAVRDWSDVTISRNNVSNSFGAGISIGNNSKAVVEGNTISDCISAGIRMDGTETIAAINDNIILNSNAVGILVAGGNIIIHHNLLTNNANGGITFEESARGEIYNNTVYGNNDLTGRGISISAATSPVTNNIVYGYSVGIFISGKPDIDYNCTFNNQGYNGPPGAGGDNSIEKDPEFKDISSSNFDLKETSPCINTGNPNSKYNDPDGSRSDIGAYYYLNYQNIEADEINQNYFLGDLILHPNPANNIFNLRFTVKQIGIADIKISNLEGDLIYTVLDKSLLARGEYHFKLDVSDYPKGVYFINIGSPVGFRTLNLIVK